jgi:hypothetical protein
MDLNLESMSQVASIIVGGGVVTAFWSWRADRLAQYRYLDEVYAALLALYREAPAFGDPTKTASFETAYDKDDAPKYHFFAVTAMNTMETIFDVLREHPMRNKQWKHIFKFHVMLHWPWLQQNGAMFEPKFLAYCKSHLVDTHTAARRSAAA